jgi:arylsulfatase/arylsulfatase A
MCRLTILTQRFPRTGFLLVLAFTIWGLPCSAVWAAPAEPPNVVLIMTDDQGVGDFGVMGNPVIETPHLDAMAGRSASMSTFYVCPVCTPTRACLMTGRYNYRTRAIDTYVGRAMMEPEEVTVAEVLQAAGYATGIFGKWHLGDCYPMRAIDQGFEEALVLRGGGLAQPSEPRENGRRYTDPILFHNGHQVETTGYCTDVYFNAATKFIEQTQQAGRPFFVYLPTNAPHSPFHDVPEALREHYRQQDLSSILVDQLQGKQRADAIDQLSRIAAMITNIDQNVGRLFAKLDRLELTDNTLVIFLVDNGPNSRRFVGPFRGSKTDILEGGIRSPLWLHWPGRLQPGTTRDEMAAHIDLLPTILEACQVELPADLKLDGRSLLPLLEDPTVPWPDRVLATQWHRGDLPVRYHHFMIRDARWKLLNNSKFQLDHLIGPPQLELYDLLTDPGESHNLANSRPGIVARLKNSYDQWFDDVSSTRPDNYAPPRIVLGSTHENPTVLTRQDWRSSDGWSRGALGHWQVTIARAGHFDLSVLLDVDSSNGDSLDVDSLNGRAEGCHVELRVADVAARQAVDRTADSCLFQDVVLPKGDARVEVVQTLKDGKQLGAYQVIVTRR